MGFFWGSVTNAVLYSFPYCLWRRTYALNEIKKTNKKEKYYVTVEEESHKSRLVDNFATYEYVIT